MKLYIANATRQIQDFLYRLYEIKAPRVQHIPPGEQVQISGDLQTEDIDYIIQQHAPYGLISASEAKRAKGFNGMCYSVDSPVKHDAIASLMDSNIDALVIRGQELRRNAAVAANNLVEQTHADSRRPERLRAMEMSVVEDTKNPEGDPIDETIRVDREGEHLREGPSTRSNGKKRR